MRQSTRQSRPSTKRQWRSTRQRSQMLRRGKTTKKRKKKRRRKKKLPRRHQKRLSLELEDVPQLQRAHMAHLLAWVGQLLAQHLESNCAESWVRRGGSCDSGCSSCLTIEES